MLHLRETLTMPSNYYQDITDTAPKSMKESLSRYNYNGAAKSKMLESLNKEDTIVRLLRESKVDENIINRVVNNLREGGVNVGKQRIYRVPVARFDNINGNHRRYPEKLWENVMNNQESAWRGLAGLADHPEGDTNPGSFKDSSIVWLGMEIDKPNKLVYGIGSFVGPYGHLAQEIIDVGGRVGFSSSGFGELMADGETVNPDTYQIERLADVVLNPSQEVYGVINDEAKNIEYSKQHVDSSMSQVNESMDNNGPRMQENTQMETKETAVKAALSKVEEKELRKHINTYLKENVNITNPIKQLADLKEIQALIQEGQLSDLEDDVKAKLAETQKRIEDMVEYGLKMKESEVTVTTNDGTEVHIAGDDAAKAAELFTAPAPVVEEPVVEDTPAEEPEVPAVDAIIADEPAEDETPAEEPAAEEEDEIDPFYEARHLSVSEEKAIRKYTEDFLAKDFTGANPLQVLTESNEVLTTVRESKLDDLEAKVIDRIQKVQESLNKDIAAMVEMKKELGSDDLVAITEAAKKLMTNGSLLADQVVDYKKLSEGLLQRNQALTKEYQGMKIKVGLLESKEDNDNLAKNQKIVSLTQKVEELQEAYDTLDKSAGDKLFELQESLKKYQAGNAKLEKQNGLLETRIRDMATQTKKFSEALKAKMDEARKSRGMVAKLTADLKETKAALKEAQEVEDNTAELDELREANARLTKQVRAYKKMEESYKAEAAKKAEEKIVETKKTAEISNLVSTRETAENYVSNEAKKVNEYYNDLEAKYHDAILPFKESLLGARTLREAQRVWLSVMNRVDTNRVEVSAMAENTPVVKDDKIILKESGLEINTKKELEIDPEVAKMRAQFGLA